MAGPTCPLVQAGFPCDGFGDGQRFAAPGTTFSWLRRIGDGPSGRSDRNGRGEGTRA